MIMDYFVYIIDCKDGSYYTGVTSDLEKRIMNTIVEYLKVILLLDYPLNLFTQTDLQILMMLSMQKTN
jgi:hypothetical protein